MSACPSLTEFTDEDLLAGVPGLDDLPQQAPASLEASATLLTRESSGDVLQAEGRGWQPQRLATQLQSSVSPQHPALVPGSLLPPAPIPAPYQPVPPPQPPTGSHPAPRVVFLNYRRTAEGDSSCDLPDHQLAQRFHDQLHASGRFAWWANSNIPGFGIPPGQPFDEGLAHGLARTHSFVALLSQDGLARLARLTADSPCDMVLVRRALASHSAPCGACGVTCWLDDECACPAARWNFGWPTSCGAAAASPEF